MLRRITVRSLVLILGALVCMVAAPGHAAAQDSSVVCARRDLDTQVCTLELTVELSGDPPTLDVAVAGSGGGFQPNCDRGPHYNPDPQRAQVEEVPCQHPAYGWYSRTYDCYFTRADGHPPDAPGVVLPSGYQPNDPGAVYFAMCYTASLPGVHDNYCFCVPPGWFGNPNLIFLPSPPDGYEQGQPDPVPALLARAINEMELQAPIIGTAPPSGQGSGLVRLPVWLWNEVNENNWGTPSATVGPVSGISVIAEARATKITWQMGDGRTVVCDEGVAWERGMNVLDPPCGHQYERASRHEPEGVYRVSATTTWVLEWRTEGLPEEEGGEFDLQATSTTTLVIEEVQVLVRSR